jgi:hypothetical protein
LPLSFLAVPERNSGVFQDGAGRAGLRVQWRRRAMERFLQ